MDKLLNKTTFLFFAFCLCLAGCTEIDLKQIVPSTTLELVSALPNSVYSGDVVSIQPDFKLIKSGSLHTSSTDSVLLSLYSDSSCMTAAPGVFSVTANPVALILGATSFSDTQYTNSSGLEESVFFKASTVVGAVSSCVGPIHVLHHFNTGFGYNTFQPGGLGAAGRVNASKEDLVYRMQLDSQGRTISAGQSLNAAGGYELTIWRYNPDGSLDTTFGNGTTAGLGYVLFQPGGLGAAGGPNASKYDLTYGFEIDSLGRYVLSGYSRNAAGGYELTIWRYNPDGSIDTTFGNGTTAGLGYVLFQPGGLGAAGRINASKIDFSNALKIDSLGRYVLSGYSRNVAGRNELAIWRYNPDGSIDTTFGNGTTAGLGYVLFQPGGLGAGGAVNASKTDVVYSMEIDSSGRYVLPGYSVNAAGSYDMTIWRYNPDGSIDTTFGNGTTAGLGYVLFQPGGLGAAGRINASRDDDATGFKIDSSGRYVLSGYSKNVAGRNELVIWRYNPDGSLDTTFGNGTTAGLGYVLFQPGGLGAAGRINASKYDDAYGFEIDSLGRYVLAGYSGNAAGGTELVIWRYNPDGSLDTTFGNGTTAGLGYVLFQPGGLGTAGAVNASKYDFPSTLKIDSSGRYVLSGYSQNAAGSYELAIWRYLSSGALDQ